MTLMFAGHDTSTSTISFQLYELSKAHEARTRLQEELVGVLGGDAPGAAPSTANCPTWTWSPTRRCACIRPPGSGRAGRSGRSSSPATRFPPGAYVNYCSYASHRLSHVFPDPHAFDPDRFTKERKTALPRGAYVPFGSGSRICIGKKFGQTEVKLVTAMALQRFDFELLPGHEMTVRQMPTLGPKGGLPMRRAAPVG